MVSALGDAQLRREHGMFYFPRTPELAAGRRLDGARWNLLVRFWERACLREMPRACQNGMDKGTDEMR